VSKLAGRQFFIPAANQLQSSYDLNQLQKFEKAAILCYNKRLGITARAENFSFVKS
jgi:hypothetical protein